MASWTQANRDFSIWTRFNEAQKKSSPDEPDIICLLAVEAHEYVSQPFLYKCVVECTTPGLRVAAALIGTWATIRIRYRDLYYGSADSYMYLPRSGVIRSCKPVYGHDTTQPGDPQPPSDDTVRTYVLELVPWFSFLDLITDFRIFQDADVVTILDEVFFDEIQNPSKSWTAADLYDITKLKKQDYPKLEYCVQYRENTFDFLSRLMEEYGIFYYFDHGDAEMQNVTPTVRQSKLVLCDKNEHFPALDQRIITCKPPSEGNGGSVDTWNHRWEPRSHAWTLARANFAHPNDPIRGRYESGFSILSGTSRYDFPDRSVDTEDEKTRAQRRAELETTGAELVQGSSGDCRTFFAGGQFGFFADAEDGDHNLLLPEDAEILGAPDPHQPIMVKGRKYALLQVNWNASEPYEDANWKAIAQIAQDDLSSPGGIIANGSGSLAQQTLPPTEGTLYTPYNLFAWFGAGVLAKFVSDVFATLFKKPQPTFNVTFTAVPLESRFLKPDGADPFPWPFRPVRATPKPRIYGPLLGVVVKDPSVESTARDICLDQFGRVRVRFWWDRSWPPWPADQHKGPAKRMTAWLRVAENWADNQWGTYFPARVGQEVIVSFIDGDPDRPIVTGRVYNGAQPPPFLQPGMQRQTLPPGAMKPDSVKIQTELHYSGIKTQSTPRPDRPAKRFHLLRFDDSWSKEQYLIRSQGRLDITAFASRFETIHGDRHLTVGGQDPQTGESGGDYIAKIGGEYELHIVKDRFEHVEQLYQLHVGQDVSFMFDQNWNTATTETVSVMAASIVLNASENITLNVGASFIVLGPGGIYINGPMVYINSGGSPSEPNAASASEPKDPTQADPGDDPQ